MTNLPFRTLLYRYFFINWLFLDASRATGWERQRIVRHNRRQAAWLPTYMLRWATLGMFFYAIGGVGEMWSLADVARWIYAASAMCLGYMVMTATAWVGITQRDDATDA